MNNDPFDGGTPKYQTAAAIYDGLCELAQGEEMGILSEMFSDVSYDAQEYYYTDKGYALKEKFEELSDYGEKMWLMELAVLQVDDGEMHSLVFEALLNPDLARRLGFKKLFTENMLRGDGASYTRVSERFLAEMEDLDAFDFYTVFRAFNRAMQACGLELYDNPYPNLCGALQSKVGNLRLQQETQLIVECRALLTSYDDFLLGLRMNQALYEAQEEQYNAKVALLQANYETAIRRLCMLAESKGIAMDPHDAVKFLSETVVALRKRHEHERLI